jgi:TPR repeat protein
MRTTAAACLLAVLVLAGCATQTASKTQASDNVGDLFAKAYIAEGAGRRAEAFGYLTKAIDLGNKDALFMAAALLEKSPDWPDHLARAYALYVRSAANGEISSKYRVAKMLLDGSGVPQNTDQGVAGLVEIADRDTSRASVDAKAYVSFAAYELALRCYHGDGTGTDLAKAFRYCMISASCGFSQAQNLLGLFYELGIGTEPDRFSAAVWYNIAAASDSPPRDWLSDRDRAMGSLSPDQRREAQAKAGARFAEISAAKRR